MLLRQRDRGRALADGDPAGFLLQEEKQLTEIARLKKRDTPRARVFLSYASADRDFATRLTNNLLKYPYRRVARHLPRRAREELGAPDRRGPRYHLRDHAPHPLADQRGLRERRGRMELLSRPEEDGRLRSSISPARSPTACPSSSTSISTRATTAEGAVARLVATLNRHRSHGSGRRRPSSAFSAGKGWRSGVFRPRLPPIRPLSPPMNLRRPLYLAAALGSPSPPRRLLQVRP